MDKTTDQNAHFKTKTGSIINQLLHLTDSGFWSQQPLKSFLLSWQADNGSFPETGAITYKLVQDDAISTTAYVVLAFFDSKQRWATEQSLE